MSDEKLRDLERRWKNTGRIEDEVAFLRERVRLGELDPARLELAAFLGHPASRLASGRSGKPDFETEDLHHGIAHMPRFGHEACVRALVAIGRAAMTHWHRAETIPSEALRAAEDFVLCPCSEHAAKAAAASERYLVHFQTIGFFGAGEAAADAATAAGSRGDDDTPELQHAVWAATCPLGPQADLLTEEDLREAVRRELIPWALDEHDPIVNQSVGR